MASDWGEATLAQLGRIVTGKTPPSNCPEYFGGDIPFVTPTDFNGRRFIDSTGRYLTEAGMALVGNSRIPAGAVMVSCIGSDMGKAAVAYFDCVTNQQINSIIVEPDNDPLFVYYNLSARKEEFRSVAGGSAQPILKKSAFGRLKIVLPPLSEQRAIAHILGTLDDKIELNRKMNQTLEAIARAIFKSWFVDFDPVIDNALAAGKPIPEEFADRAARRAQLVHGKSSLPENIRRLFPDEFQDSELGPIPKGWEVDSLSRVAALETTTVFPRRSPDIVWEYYSIPAFDEGRWPKLERGRDIKSGKYSVPMTCVLASKLNPQFPRVWLPDVIHEAVAICSTEFMPFVPHKAEWRSFLYELLQSDFIQQQIRARATGSTGSRQRVKPRVVAEMPIVVPSEPVLGQFGLVVSPLHGRLLHNQTTIRTLAALRDTLLPKLISGELRVPDVEKILKERGL